MPSISCLRCFFRLLCSCAEIKVERADGAKALKEAEEASIKGEDVAVHFKLPDGSTVAASFPIGQDIAFLKGHLRNERGFPIEKQVRYGSVWVQALLEHRAHHFAGLGHGPHCCVSCMLSRVTEQSDSPRASQMPPLCRLPAPPPPFTSWLSATRLPPLLPLPLQIFSAGGAVLIDPLSLRDYPIFTAAAAAGGSVEVNVQLREE